MSETDLQMNQLDLNELNNDLKDINQTIQGLMYLLYYIGGASSVLAVGFLTKLYKNCYQKKEKIIKIDQENLVSLIDLEKKIDNIDNKIAVAIKINEDKDESKEKN